MSCAVCEKQLTSFELPGGVIFQNNLVFIAHFPFRESAKPHYGHIIVETKRHITSPSQMTDSEAAAVGIWLHRVSLFLESKLAAEHTYLFRIGDVTPHLHFHAVPRFQNTPRQLWGISLYENAEGRKADGSDIKIISEEMRQFFSQQEFK